MSRRRFHVDGWLESLKRNSPRFAAADATDDNSHDGHGFVTVLFGGGIGWLLLTLVQMVAGSYGWELPWTADAKIIVGCAAANLFYLVDEVLTRREDGWDYKPWDFWGDWYKPACLWVPAAVGSMPLLYAMLAVLAVWYYAFRPYGSQP